MEAGELYQKIYARIEELPTLPAVVPKLLELMQNPNTNAADLTAVISRDPALAAKVLKVANSAYYGFPQKIADVKHAVALLGFNMVKSLAISIGIIKSLPRGRRPSPYFSAAGLWLHSLAVATAMQELGRRFAGADDREYLFIVGLLHDLGKVVLDQFFPELFQEVLERANVGQQSKLHLVEREIIGIDHCEVSAMLLTRWKFPAKIVQPVAGHHQPQLASGASVVDVTLLRIANVLAQELGIGKEGNSIAGQIRPGDLEAVSADEGAVGQVRSFLFNKQEELEAFFAALA
ncbi:MAG: HDOD domain-containing protein [Deltaproteobacteria bacterium]|nr:HDOD domain-containing protein [Candidatus Anaeroferrophillus wilburensis]MBN2887800.1 HDOD domain-containing protein [Deltaproteobacteria bacterium]